MKTNVLPIVYQTRESEQEDQHCDADNVSVMATSEL